MLLALPAGGDPPPETVSFSFDTLTGEWRELAGVTDIQERRHYACGVLDDKISVCGGHEVGKNVVLVHTPRRCHGTVHSVCRVSPTW